jgi:deoxyribonucleoside regulator
MMRESDANAVYVAAHLYYERRLTQEEIARELGITRPTVSKLLSRVQQEGIVQIAVREPEWRNSDLEAPLIDTLGLDTVIFVPESLRSARTREIL